MNKNVISIKRTFNPNLTLLARFMYFSFASYRDEDDEGNRRMRLKLNFEMILKS